ncbi:hypothetical protein SRRS_15180 [Sporomusa rhizae]|uniref:hypothetical protein n=1 Tax=Sporomusa rhizae TaxID=357999 RepID=UPI00352B3960
MDTSSAFMAFYTWVKDPNLIFDIGKTIVEGATYDIFKKLGTSFVSQIRPFFSNEDEAQKYFEQICVSSSINTKEPHQDIIKLFENLTTNKIDERIRQQFVRELKKWFADHSHEINRLIEESRSINEFDIMINNFINIYKIHGISKTKIIKVIPSEFGLKMKNFSDNESIMDVISPELLKWTSSFFNVQIDWLDGTSKSIYRCKNYLSLQELFNLVIEIKFIKDKNVEAYFLKSTELDCNSERTQRLTLFLRYQIATVDKHPIYRYIPIGREWNWGWEKSRYEFKHIIYFFEKVGVANLGYDVDSNVLSNLIFGAMFPGEIIDNQKKKVWYPEDYIDLLTENVCAKEIRETKKCRSDFYEKGYEKNISFEIDRIISNEGYRKYVKEFLLSKFKEDWEAIIL